jgi:two-component system sensor histidine kinase DegS
MLPGYGGALELQERERLRVAFDLHDGPAQAISAALLQARLIETCEGEELRRGVEELKGLLTFALEDMYGIIEHLRSRALENEGLVSKLRSHVEEFARADGTQASFTLKGEEPALTDSAQIAVFRIVQEALSNVRRHALADHVSVHLALSPDEVVCTVEDDGRGFNRTDAQRPDDTRQRYGLAGMCERARMLDGECVISSQPGKGTAVTLRIPVWRGGCRS